MRRVLVHRNRWPALPRYPQPSPGQPVWPVEIIVFEYGPRHGQRVDPGEHVQNALLRRGLSIACLAGSFLKAAADGVGNDFCYRQAKPVLLFPEADQIQYGAADRAIDRCPLETGPGPPSKPIGT